MHTETLRRFAWPANLWQTAVFLFFALSTAVVVCLAKQLIVLVFEVSLFVMLVAFSKTKLNNLVIAYVLSDHLSQLFKRLIFLWGPQLRPLYYGLQVLPNFVLLVGLLFASYSLFRRNLPRSAKFLMGYVGVSLIATLLNFRSVPLQAGLAGLLACVFPLIALLIGITLPIDLLGRLSRVFTALILISVAYGTYQFIEGPTAIDRAWADATREYSSEAVKVFQAIHKTGSDFRAYSYYADHATWGLFLATAIVGVILSTRLGLFPKKWLVVVIPFGLTGMLICETRTVWLAFLGTLAVYRIITIRVLRRPMLLTILVLSLFVLVVTMGDYAVRNYGFGGFSSSIVNRYLTVGTLEARTSAWRLFVKNLPIHWLLGTGFGYGSADPTVTMNEEMYSHNMYVDILVISGLPGLLLFMAFFYAWIQETFWLAKVSLKPVSRAALWMVAMAVGMLFTGCFQGPLFMTSYLALLLGLFSGETMRLRTAVTSLCVPIAA